MMKNYIAILSSLIFTLAIFSGSANVVHADSANFYPPPCVAGLDAYGNPTPTCGYFSETFTIDNLDTLSAIAYIYRVNSDENSAPDFTSVDLATSTSVTLQVNPYKEYWDYIVFAKNQLKNVAVTLDPMAIFKVTRGNDWNGNQVVWMSILPSSAVQKGLMDFVVSKDDDALGLSALATSGYYNGTTTPPVIDGKFVKLNSDAVNPYIQTLVTDPRKNVDFFYSPLGIYGGNKIVIYKSKEIDTLDDGSQKTITFPAPKIDGVVSFTSGISNTPQVSVPTIASTSTPVSRSWWSDFWCFIKGLFGSSC